MHYDARNRKELERLHPKVARKLNKILQKAEQSDLEILITDGYRTNAEQNKLYAQGRTRSGKIVTNAKGGQSLHNYGLAVDIVPVLSNGQIDYSDYDTYKLFASLAKEEGFAWGGDWKKFKDVPHFEYTEGHDWQYFAKGGKLSQELADWLQPIYDQARQKGITTPLDTKVGDMSLDHLLAVITKFLS